MAAKGLVPASGADLVTLLAQLSADADSSVAKAAEKSLLELPDAVLLPACDADIPPAILDRVGELFRNRDDVIAPLVQNGNTPDETVARAARGCSERVSEIIATNQQRMLGAPRIIEALYKNQNVRMSTADRLIELAARHELELTGIPAYKEHVEAIRGQLIPEPSEEPLPSDAQFTQAMSEDEDDPEAVEQTDDEGTEEVKKKFVPLNNLIMTMGKSEKIRLALLGNAAARAILIRDHNKAVAYAAVSSPKMTDKEAVGVACSKEVSEEILRYVGNRKEWLRNYELKRALVYNPKTPVGISLRFVAHMRDSDLKTLARSRNIPNSLKSVASQRLDKKTKTKK